MPQQQKDVSNRSLLQKQQSSFISKQPNSLFTLNLQVYGHQVSGKTPKFTDRSQKYIYKSYSQKQAQFFSYLSSCTINHKSYLLSKFIPHCLGVFTQAQILRQEDLNNSFYENKNVTNQIVEPVQQIIEQQLPTLNTVSERKQWIQHINMRTVFEKNQKFLKMKNLTYGYKYPNIMDLKLGIKQKPKSMKKLLHNTTKSHGFRINGLSVRQFDPQHKTEDGVERFMSKYYCQKIGQEHLNKHLAFFLFDGYKIHEQLLDKIIQQLKEIILGFLSFTDIKFESSSLYLAYDAYNPKNFTINFIDFDKYSEKQGVDETVELGLKSCLRHFIEIKNSLQSISTQLLNKQLMYFHENHDVVPKQKVKQYKSRSKNLIQLPEQQQQN